MTQTRLKRLLILNIPYVLIGLYATKLAEAWRLAEGTEISEKLLHLMDGFLGNDMMIHAGDPVGFADLKSSKWSDKIYGFGRLPVD